jgi:hypothetical protein
MGSETFRKTALRPLYLVCALVALVLVGPLLRPAAARAVEGWVVERVTNDHLSDNGAVLRGHNVVWAVGQDATSRTICWRDLETGVTRTLTDSAYQLLSVQFDGTWVVWQEGVGNNAEIWAYNISTLGGYRVTNNAVADVGPILDDGYAVWSHNDGHDGEVYLCHLASGHVQAVTDDSADQRVVAMGGSLVVWRTLGPSPSLVLHDRAAHASHTLASGEGIDPMVSVDEGRVVWAQKVGGDYEVFMWDSAHGTKQLTDNTIDDRLGSIAGSYAAWATWTADARQEVILLDLDTAEVRVLFQGVQASRPTVSQGRVIWAGREPGISDAATFLYDCKYRRTVKLSSDEWGTGSTTLDGDRAAWIAWPAASEDSSTCEVFTAFVPRFADVSASSPYATAIMAMQYLGLISGYEHGSHWDFHPADPVRRAQFAKMADGMMNLPVSEDLVAPFADLGADDPSTLYPHDYVAAAAARGVTLGITPTEFGPYLDISRAQAVTMVVRALVSMGAGDPLVEPPAGYVGSLGGFDPTHGPTMRRAEYNDLLAGLVGYGADWDPWAQATRGEVAQIIVNAIRALTKHSSA